MLGRTENFFTEGSEGNEGLGVVGDHGLADSAHRSLSGSPACKEVACVQQEHTRTEGRNFFSERNEA